MQTTVKHTLHFNGIGLHGGKSCHMSIAPAPASHGICFRRSDLPGQKIIIPALWNRVVPSRLCTMLSGGPGMTISTIEHLMFALSACGVHNALISVDGPEVPIMDGSARHFVDAICSAGLHVMEAPLKGIEILKTVEVRKGEAFARFDPSPYPVVDFTIDFDDPAIGFGQKIIQFEGDNARRELSDSRTFCMQSDIDMMRQTGIALGGSLMNAVVFDNGQVCNPDGLRHSDEPLRHKMLDAIGDLSLAGFPIIGRYTGYRAGHALTRQLIASMYTDLESYRRIDLPQEMEQHLPGLQGHCQAA